MSRVPGSRSSKITSVQIQKAVHDALAKQDCRVDADKLAKDVSAQLLDEPKTLAAAIAGVTLQSASLPNKFQKEPEQKQPDGLAGLMRGASRRWRPSPRRAPAGRTWTWTATNASGWTVGAVRHQKSPYCFYETQLCIKTKLSRPAIAK